ncbi:hypothetical protein QBC33DRAFT_579434 [Phialemonium atrogriseum]|uniref:Uncharacterized protein n=1 Tax=Phialemonium atrogriseum TaxID=1093897 RepID=A0AAJ0C112_9PEZI|nr:uncharacterized protein QBC33DRAFT_579434 [Phialemonium atrogriseum]KAK1765711.1 hypothetical protein QBC33DRAFT_579434 [Phialemonium atrogriseum]
MPHDKPCYLGALAPELVDNVFSELHSIRDLDFITTFRYIYRLFERRKGPVIFRVLQNELGPVLTVPAHRMGYWDRIHTAAGIYKDMLNSSRYEGDNAVPSVAELTKLCRTFYKMNFLASTYIAAQQRLFGSEEAGTAPPSRAERLRVLRAFYRRQIVCNAWAPTTREPQWMNQDAAAISNISNHQGVRLGLFAAFEPWELQQVDHADYFVTRLCAALCLAGEEEATAALVASAGPPSLVMVRPIGEAEFGDIFSHVDHLVQYMREHPSLADAAIHALPSLPRLRHREVLDAPAYCHFVQRYLLPCLCFAWQAYRFDMQQQEEGSSSATVDYVGDAVDLPPFGWVDALDRRYLNWFGEGLHCSPGTLMVNGKEASEARFISLKLWRAAGFALWDRRRVEAIKELGQMRILRTGGLCTSGVAG